eukprot:297066-Prymnesium_polylepis.2
MAGTYVTVLKLDLYRDTPSPSPASVANAVESVEQPAHLRWCAYRRACTRRSDARTTCGLMSGGG